MVVFFVKRLLMSLLVVLISTADHVRPRRPAPSTRSPTSAPAPRPTRPSRSRSRIAELHLDDPVLYALLLLAQGRQRLPLRQLRPRRELADPPAGDLAAQRGRRRRPSSWSAPPRSWPSCSASWSASSARCASTPASTTRSPSCPSCSTRCPVFWVAVLAKVFLAIDFNDFLARSARSPSGDRSCSPRCSSGLVVAAAVGGRMAARGCATFAIAGGGRRRPVLVYLNVTDLFKEPVDRHRR